MDRPGYEPELPAYVDDLMETFAADGSETSEEAGQRDDGLARELRCTRAMETAIELAAQIECYMQDLVAVRKAYLAGTGATLGLSQWALRRLLCQDFKMGGTNSGAVEAQVRALGRLANMSYPRGD